MQDVKIRDVTGLLTLADASDDRNVKFRRDAALLGGHSYSGADVIEYELDGIPFKHAEPYKVSDFRLPV